MKRIGWRGVLIAVSVGLSGSGQVAEGGEVQGDVESSIGRTAIQSLDDLELRFRVHQDFYHLITPPSDGFILVQPDAAEVVPVVMRGFEASVRQRLFAEYAYSVPVYPVRIAENPWTRTLDMYNAAGQKIATFGGLGSTEDVISWRRIPWREDPARIQWTACLVATEDVAHYQYAREQVEASRPQPMVMPSAMPEDGGGQALMLMEVGETNLHLGDVVLSGGGIDLTVAWPAGSVSTQAFDVFVFTNLPPSSWRLVATTNVDPGETSFVWSDEEPLDEAVRMYECWTLHDHDDDGLSDGREGRLYGTRADMADTDGDGIGDGEEVLLYGTDPVATHHSLLPYSADFETSNAYNVGLLDGQNGWEADGGVHVTEGSAAQGQQAVQIEGMEKELTKHLATTNQEVEVVLFAHLGEQAMLPNDLPDEASCLVSFEAGVGLRAFDGDGQGSGTWITVPGTAHLLHQWVEVRLLQHYASKTWDLEVDREPVLSNLGFKDASVAQLGAFHLRSGLGGAVNLDDVRIP